MGVFEMRLKEVVDEDKRMALIDVADTCDMGRLWFEGCSVSYTAADLLRFAELVLHVERNGTET